MTPEIREKLQALGEELSPPMMQGTTALMASIAASRDAEVRITRDHLYGPDPRNRLDIFSKGRPKNVPVLVYVHGGGFVMGDKTSPGSPFYDNVGQWAAQQGWIGVTLTYRLAPAHRWPSGPEDMAHAVQWLRAHVAESGGDPEKIFLMGQSAGAAHVGAYVSHQRFQPHGGAGIAGAVLVSGIFDPTTQPPNQFSKAYYGEDRSTLVEARNTPGLLASQVPLLFTVSEFDPRDFQDQAALLAQAWHQRKGRFPPLKFLAGHNHLSPAQSIGSGEDQLARRVADFIAVVSRR
ncbi:MAG TPA: alpha/beta hydrolase [Steroidobacteraceae bacterium]|nr:alpha/beta hydrolase [Steroidobacteraceae bacterium]